MNVIKKYKEKWQQENVNKNKTAVSRLRWPQDECSSTQNQGGRNGRQQWVAPVCLLPIPQSEDTCWMFSCHICHDTLENNVWWNSSYTANHLFEPSLEADALQCSTTSRLQEARGWLCTAEQTESSSLLSAPRAKCSRARLSPNPQGGLCGSPRSASACTEDMTTTVGR